MKSFIKFILCIIVLAITLLLGSNSLQSEKITSNISIENIKKESILLISNNKGCEEVSIRKKNNQSNFLSSTPIIFSNFSYNIILDYINPQEFLGVIYCLSDLLNKGLYIRAP